MNAAFTHLARLEQAHESILEKSDAAASEHQALVERRAARQQDADAALAAFRSGELPEATAALKRDAALADCRDLDGLIGQAHARTVAVSGELAQASQAVHAARQAVEQETRQQELAVLQRAALDAQEALLAAVAAASVIWRQLNPRSLRQGSASSVFDPSAELRGLVVANDVPRLRTPH
jgi:hypothetical protein